MPWGQPSAGRGRRAASLQAMDPYLPCTTLHVHTAAVQAIGSSHRCSQWCGSGSLIAVPLAVWQAWLPCSGASHTQAMTTLPSHHTQCLTPTSILCMQSKTYHSTDRDSYSVLRPPHVSVFCTSYSVPASDWSAEVLVRTGRNWLHLHACMHASCAMQVPR